MIVAVAALCVCATICRAEEDDMSKGAHFVEPCKKSLEKFDPKWTFTDGHKIGQCRGITTTAAMLSTELDPPFKSCVPETVQVNQVVRVVLAYLEKNLQTQHEPFLKLVVQALAEVWPCKK